jgi:hypothetical protein
MPATAPLLRSVPYFGSPPGPLIPQSGIGQPLLVAAALRSAPSASALGVSKLLSVSGKLGDQTRNVEEEAEERKHRGRQLTHRPVPWFQGESHGRSSCCLKGIVGATVWMKVDVERAANACS